MERKKFSSRFLRSTTESYCGMDPGLVTLLEFYLRFYLHLSPSYLCLCCFLSSSLSLSLSLWHYITAHCTVGVAKIFRFTCTFFGASVHIVEHLPAVSANNNDRYPNLNAVLCLPLNNSTRVTYCYIICS